MAMAGVDSGSLYRWTHTLSRLAWSWVANLTTISKVIERLVLDRLLPHLLSSPNFSRLQSAYWRGHSTETALLHLMNTVYADHDVLASILSHSSVLSALPPAGYGRISAAVSSSCVLADTRLL